MKIKFHKWRVTSGWFVYVDDDPWRTHPNMNHPVVSHLVTFIRRMRGKG